MHTDGVIYPKDANLFQCYLFPVESKKIIYLMHKAGEFAKHENPLVRHVLSVVCLVMAAAFSFFNSISFILQLPFKILVNVVSVEPITLLMDFVSGIWASARSLAFVVMSPTIFVAGLIYPELVFSYFAPAEPINEVVLLQEKVKALEEERKQLLDERTVLESDLQKAKEVGSKLEKENQSLTKVNELLSKEQVKT